MILPKLVQKRYANKRFAQTGIDSLHQCLDPEHFKDYPHKVVYEYNSYGYRDFEWPTDRELKDCIWCFGDSFTVGLGSPREHTWVGQLEQKANARCINISLDGASNDWIADKILEVSDVISPERIAVQWSYLHRGQHPNTDATDSERKIAYKYVELDQQVDHFESVLERVQHINIVHSMIPNAHENQEHDKLESLKNKFGIIGVTQLDVARDGHHYDIETASNVAEQILLLL